jgi:putative ABC transport system permease protein
MDDNLPSKGYSRVLIGCFAGVALVLACLGLYGVLSYGVSQRTREIGVRIALGASGAQVRKLVLRQAAVVLGIGIVIGLVGALALGRWLSSLVYEISPREPSALVATVVLLSVAALIAAWLPAWRASRVDPRVAERVRSERLRRHAAAERPPRLPGCVSVGSSAPSLVQFSDLKAA